LTHFNLFLCRFHFIEHVKQIEIDNWHKFILLNWLLCLGFWNGTNSWENRWRKSKYSYIWIVGSQLLKCSGNLKSSKFCRQVQTLVQFVGWLLNRFPIKHTARNQMFGHSELLVCEFFQFSFHFISFHFTTHVILLFSWIHLIHQWLRHLFVCLFVCLFLCSLWNCCRVWTSCRCRSLFDWCIDSVNLLWNCSHRSSFVDTNNTHLHWWDCEYRDKGLTPEIPSNCPQKLAELMQMCCWKKQPQQRPVSSSLCLFLFLISFYFFLSYNRFDCFLDQTAIGFWNDLSNVRRITIAVQNCKKKLWIKNIIWEIETKSNLYQ
jgi:hypothetical protein